MNLKAQSSLYNYLIKKCIHISLIPMLTYLLLAVWTIQKRKHWIRKTHPLQAYISEHLYFRFFVFEWQEKMESLNFFSSVDNWNFQNFNHPDCCC